jgi:hypothetical protein
VPPCCYQASSSLLGNAGQDCTGGRRSDRAAFDCCKCCNAIHRRQRNFRIRTEMFFGFALKYDNCTFQILPAQRKPLSSTHASRPAPSLSAPYHTSSHRAPPSRSPAHAVTRKPRLSNLGSRGKSPHGTGRLHPTVSHPSILRSSLSRRCAAKLRRPTRAAPLPANPTTPTNPDTSTQHLPLSLHRTTRD